MSLEGEAIQTFVQWAVDSGSEGGGDAPEACDLSSDKYGIPVKESYIDGECPGILMALMDNGLTFEEAKEYAIEHGLYSPDELHLDDPEHKESALLPKEDEIRVVKYADGETRVFDKNNRIIAGLDCNGNPVHFTEDAGGTMINSEECPTCLGVGVGCPTCGGTEELIVVEESEPTPESPTEGRVRLFESFAYRCIDGVCGIFQTTFLTFDSVAGAREFFASAEGQEVLRDLTASGKLGNCVYITDGLNNIQQMDMATEDVRVKGHTDRQLVLNSETGAPTLPGEPHDSIFEEQTRRGSSGRIRTKTDFTIEEEDFEERLSRGIGDASDANGRHTPTVGEKDQLPNTNTVGVGGIQELSLDPETGRYEYVPVEQAMEEGESAIVAAAGLTTAEYEAVKNIVLPAEFYDADASVNDRARALRDAIQIYNEVNGTDVELSTVGSKNLARIITEQGLGEDGNMRTFNEEDVTRNQQLILQTQYGDSSTTVEHAVKVSARNREFLLRATTLPNRQ